MTNLVEKRIICSQCGSNRIADTVIKDIVKLEGSEAIVSMPSKRCQDCGYIFVLSSVHKKIHTSLWNKFKRGELKQKKMNVFDSEDVVAALAGQ